MKFIQSKIALVVSSFLVGGFSTYFITDYIRLKSKTNTKTVLSNNRSQMAKALRFKNDIDNSRPFRKIDKIHDQIRKRIENSFGQNLFDNNIFGIENFEDIAIDKIKIEEHEDDDYKYLKIIADGIDETSVNINDGMVSVTGEIKKTEDNKLQGGWTSSSSISRFSRNFNIPYGVNEDNVKVDTEEGGIVIKFPKKKT